MKLRIVEIYDAYAGMSFYYLQRRWFGFLYFTIDKAVPSDRSRLIEKAKRLSAETGNRKSIFWEN